MECVIVLPVLLLFTVEGTQNTHAKVLRYVALRYVTLRCRVDVLARLATCTCFNAIWRWTSLYYCVALNLAVECNNMQIITQQPQHSRAAFHVSTPHATARKARDGFGGANPAVWFNLGITRRAYIIISHFGRSLFADVLWLHCCFLSLSLIYIRYSIHTANNKTVRVVAMSQT